MQLNYKLNSETKRTRSRSNGEQEILLVLYSGCLPLRGMSHMLRPPETSVYEKNPSCSTYALVSSSAVTKPVIRSSPINCYM
jgi:hypothetical protein